MALCLKKTPAKVGWNEAPALTCRFCLWQAGRLPREEDDPREAVAAKRRKVRASALG